MASTRRIGAMIPSTNTTFEADFQLLPQKDLTIHSQRLWITNEAEGEESMNRMNAEIENAARYLATAKVHAIAYGCTTGSFYRGPGWDKDMISLIEKTAGVPAVATAPSVEKALRFFGAKKISVATPYPRWNNEKLREYLQAIGFHVLNVEGEPWASKAGNQGINEQEPEVILEFASKVLRPEADALFCSCTAWRALEVAEMLEKRTGKPVVTSNQATIWAALKKVAFSSSIDGFGRLLKSLGSQ